MQCNVSPIRSLAPVGKNNNTSTSRIAQRAARNEKTFTTTQHEWDSILWGIQKLIPTHQLPYKSVGGGGYSRPTQVPSAKICPNFHFWDGGSPETNIPEILSGALEEFCTKNSGGLACSWIAESLSQTTCVETNNPTKKPQLFYFQESQILQRRSILAKTNMISSNEDDLAFVEIRNLPGV